MIFKSYLVEENIEVLKNNFTLFYGENLGLQDDIKKILVLKLEKNLVLRYTQEQLINNENILYDELDNESLFEEKKFLISNINEKFYSIVTNILKALKITKFICFQDS